MKQMVGDVKAEWADLTDDDLAGVTNRDQLEGKIQEKYGHAKEEVSNKIDAFEKKYM